MDPTDKLLNLHLVSDATGETVQAVARACTVQFEGVEPVERIWSLVRTRAHVAKVVAGIAQHPGPVLFSLMDRDLRTVLEDGCRELGVPYTSVLDSAMGMLTRHIGRQSEAVPGRQHELNSAYFSRIAAMDYTLGHDDGQRTDGLNEADIIVLGVSRTSKTPTCLYLANRGLKVANIPLVPGGKLPEGLWKATRPMVVGLVKDPQRLVQVRRNRLRHLSQTELTDYVDLEAVRKEMTEARRLFQKHGWLTIDVTRRSIEETAAAILHHYDERQGLVT